MKIVHLISSLKIGGAERLLVDICKVNNYVKNSIVVVIINNVVDNGLLSELKSTGAQVIENKRRAGGRKQKNDIPAYVTNFDVCINLFKIDNISRAVSPLKVYEYLACGKPVVSTPMEGLSREEAGKWVRFAGRDQFTSAIAQALNGLSSSQIDTACIDAAQEFSWTSQFSRLRKHLEDFRL